MQVHAAVVLYVAHPQAEDFPASETATKRQRQDNLTDHRLGRICTELQLLTEPIVSAQILIYRDDGRVNWHQGAAFSESGAGVW
jgi:hypothetical protein